jgi:hypothetical protein
MRRASPTTAARIANYAAVPPALRTNTGFSETQAGFAGGVFFLAYAIGSPIFAGVHVEMIAAGKVLTFNILDEANKPLLASGFSGAGAADIRKRLRDAAARHTRDCIEGRSEGRHRQGRFGDRHAENGRRQVRPYVWGLASFGETGVDRVLQILDDEFITIMRQVGALDINHITRRCVTNA